MHIERVIRSEKTHKSILDLYRFDCFQLIDILDLHIYFFFMSERGRARGRGRSRPAVPSDDGSAPSGAAGATASSAEVKNNKIVCSIRNKFF